MPTALKLIAGLGNPGPQYKRTRHNVGADWVRELAREYQIPLALDSKVKAEIGRGTILGHDLRLMIPITYMNNSGEAVGAVAQFYKNGQASLLGPHIGQHYRGDRQAGTHVKMHAHGNKREQEGCLLLSSSCWLLPLLLLAFLNQNDVMQR